MIFQTNRYLPLVWDNDARGEWAVPTRWIYDYRITVMSVRLTYQALTALLRDALPMTQSVKNRLSALQQVMALRSRTQHECAYADLVEDLDDTLGRIDKSTGFTANRKRDLRSHARALSAIVVAQVAREEKGRPKARPDSMFTAVLREAFQRSSKTRVDICRATGLSPAVFGEWLRGRQPSSLNLDRLPLVEESLDLPQGALTTHTRPSRSVAEGDPCLVYRERVNARRRERYRLRIDQLPASLLGEWRALLCTRTTQRTNPRMAASGWALKPVEKTLVRPTVLNAIGAMVCPSAEVIAAHLLGLTGWLVMPRAKGGYGRSLSELRTIAWFSVPEVVDGYLSFLRDRSGRVNNAARNLASFVVSLCAEPHGYLTHCPELFDALPADVSAGRPPDVLTREAARTATDWRCRYTGRSRDPKLPLRTMASAGDLLANLWQGVRNLDAAADRLPAGSRERAAKKRDALLIALLLCVPLRIETCATLQVGQAIEDVLYRTDAGYRLRIDNIKNRRKRTGQNIDIPLPALLSDRITTYLESYRPALVATSGSLLLFPSSRNPTKTHRGLSNLIISRTRAYVPGCPGIGPHAFRHVVATEYLRRHRGEHAAVARLLLVDLDTVLKTYDQNKNDYAFELHAEDIARIQGSLER